MRALLLMGVFGLALGSTAHGQAYRCETDDGTVFSDEPCGENAEAIELEEAPTTETSESGTGQSEPDDETAARPTESPEPSTGDSDEASAPATESDNPCLKPTQDNQILAAGTPASEIRSACGEPDKVTDSDNAAFDKTLHYSAGERGVQIFIRDGAKVGHNAQ